MRRLSALALTTALLLICTSSPPAIATQVEYVSLPQLGADAGLVVRGEVVASHSFWNPTRTRILTEVTVSVEESFKGSAPQEVRIVQMGGELDGMKMTVAGSLSWQTNEEVVLFLQRSLPGRYRVAGFHQGKFRVMRDPRTRELLVEQAPLGGAELVGMAAKSVTPDRLPLRSLLRRALPSTFGGE